LRGNIYDDATLTLYHTTPNELVLKMVIELLSFLFSFSYDTE